MQQNTTTTKTRFKRIVLKISGEALSNRESGEPIDGDILRSTCEQIKALHQLGVQIGLVVGGGNIFRGIAGAKNRGIDRTTGDYMGMLATTINGLALMDCLEKMDVPVRVLSAIEMNKVAEPYILRRAIRHLEKQRVVIFVGGTGNPYFSTDTTAALRASEIDAQIVLKATKVDGIYDKDPVKFPDAVKFDEITYRDALRLNLEVMDATAFALCQDNRIPILVLSTHVKDAVLNAVLGNKIGTLVHA